MLEKKVNEKILNQIKSIITEFFQKTGLFNFEVKVSEEVVDNTITADVFMNEASIYIGERGNNLGDFDKIIKLILKKRIPLDLNYSFDINNYQRSREESIKDLAKQAARQVRQSKAPLILSPMKARERRVVHTELSHHPDIKTESIGEGVERRVVVKYLE